MHSPASVLPPEPRPASHGKNFLCALGLIALALAIYQQVWHAGFIWDDDAHLTKNVCIVGPAGFKEIWTTSEATYYPLVLSTWWFIHKFVGLNPLAFHLVNVLTHGVAAVLLWRILLRLRVRGAWLGAAIWMAHPVMVQSVAWITELKNTQSCIFFLLCVLAFLRSSNSETSNPSARFSWYAASLLFCAMAIASKSSTVVLPAVLALCLWWQNRRLPWRDLAALAPFVVLAAAASSWTIWEQKFHSGASGAEWAQSWPERIAIAGHDLWFYLGKLVWPHPLIFIYPRWHIDSSQWQAFVPAIGICLVLLACWWQRNGRWRSIAFALAYFAVVLSPVLGFFDVFFFRYSFVSDHFQYLASIGPLALAGAAISNLKLHRTVKIAAGAMLLIALMTLTWQRSRVYADPETLWQTTLAQNPACWMAHYELARPLREQGKTDAAIAEYEKGLAIWPEYAAAHYNLAAAYLDKGDAPKAIEHYETALRLEPNDAQTHNNVANVLAREGKRAAAIAHYEAAVKLRPDYPVAEYNLANALAATGDTGAAVSHFRRAAELAPNDAELHLALANGFLRTGKLREAVTQYEQTVALAPDEVPALTFFAWTLATASDSSVRNGARALQLAQRAEQLSGATEPLVLHSLAAAFAENGDFPRAVEVAERAMPLANAQNDPALSAALRMEAELYRAGRPVRTASP